jgi:hypothetical protein
MPPKKKRKVLVDEFIVRLKDKQKLLLNDSRLLEVSNVNFVRQNGSQMRYVYDIVEGILGCDVILSRMPDGQDSDDDDVRWRKVSNDEGILGGVYLIECDYEGIKLNFLILIGDLGLAVTTDPIFLARGGGGSRPGSRRGQMTDSPKSGNTVPDNVTHPNVCPE